MLFKVCLPQSSEPDRQLLCACWELLLVKLASLSLFDPYNTGDERAVQRKARGRALRIGRWGFLVFLRLIRRTFSFLFMGKYSLLTCFLNRNKIS